MGSDEQGTVRRKRTRKKLVRHPKLTAEHIAQIVRRWEQGETLKSISDSYGMDYSAFWRQTRLAWSGKNIPIPFTQIHVETTSQPSILPPKIQYNGLTDEQIAEAVERWVSGERMKDIAPTYGMSTASLIVHTKAARIGRKRKCLSTPSDEIIREILKRWQQGDSLRSIAEAHGLKTHKVAYLLRQHGVGSINNHNIPDAAILSSIEQWKHGETLRVIARRYGVSIALLQKRMLEVSDTLKYKRMLSATELQQVQQLRDYGHKLGFIAHLFRVNTTYVSDELRRANHCDTHNKVLSPLAIDEAFALWQKGAAIAEIASHFHYSRLRMQEMLIYTCWRRNWLAKDIADAFKISKPTLRKIITLYASTTERQSE